MVRIGREGIQSARGGGEDKGLPPGFHHTNLPRVSRTPSPHPPHPPLTRDKSGISNLSTSCEPLGGVVGLVFNQKSEFKVCLLRFRNGDKLKRKYTCSEKTSRQCFRPIFSRSFRSISKNYSLKVSQEDKLQNFYWVLCIGHKNSQNARALPTDQFFSRAVAGVIFLQPSSVSQES